MKGRGRGEGGVGDDASFMAVVKLSHRLFWQEDICGSGRYILVEVSFFYNHLLVFIKRALWVEEEREVVPFALFYQLLVS